MSYINKENMRANAHIQKTREYLDYVEEHIENVRKAFIHVSDACKGMAWVGDDQSWHTLRADIEAHDVSKLSAMELTQYRDMFYPVVTPDGYAKARFQQAWEHHKYANTHHHETATSELDIIHMIIDWTAMGYKFGDTAQSYYENNKDEMNIKQEHIELMYEIFDNLANHHEPID